MTNEELKEAFIQAWSRETCYPRQKDEWKKENPTIGQCAVTALVINELYGGQIVYNEEYNHFWNILPSGQEIDLTKDQFGEGITILEARVVERNEILNTKSAKRAKTANRYENLKTKVLPLLLVKS